MEKIVVFIVRKHIALVAILLVLGAIPFFWFRPGEINIGGDSSRLYFYDPLNYLKTLALYSVVPGTTGYEAMSYFFVPFVALFIVLKKMFVSPGLVTNIFHGFMLVSSFLFTYLSIVELLRGSTVNKKTFIFFAGCVGGLLYIFGPPVGNWDKAITSHNQIFLNPMVFYLLLKYFRSDNPFYLTAIFLVSFVFSVNFSYMAAPPLFSFYPFTLVYLFFYKKYIVQTPFRWKTLICFLLLFFAIQAFHLIPQLFVLFNTKSYEFKHVFTAEGVSYGLNYFNGIYQGIRLSRNLALIVQTAGHLPIVQYLQFIFPLIVFSGLIVRSSDESFRRKLNHLFLTFIFLIVFFFDTANITDTGLWFYQQLFRLPGFAMFRNFYGQFLYVFTFYYALVLGYSLYAILSVVSKKIRLFLYIVLPVILILNGWPFITGQMVKLPVLGSNDVIVPQRFDPDFEKTLEYIRKIPTDTKFMTLPLTDFGYQLIAGVDGGLYMGPSMIGFLAGKKDFMGYDTFAPYQEVLFESIKHKDFRSAQFILSLLNIRYVFYNSDPYIYTKFPGFPYNNVRKYFPDQQSIADFITNLNVDSETRFSDTYHIYKLSDGISLPNIYAATEEMYWNTLVIDSLLHDFPVSDNRLAIYGQVNDVSANPDIETLYIKPNNNSQYLDLFKHRKTLLDAPYVFRNPSWLVYPLVALKERFDLGSYRLANDHYIDRIIFYAEKRIGELDKWINETPIKGSVQSIEELDRQWKEPGLLDFPRFKEYSSWEISLVRYRRLIRNLLSQIEKNNASKSSLFTVKTDLIGVFANHHKWLRNIVRDSNRNKQEKRYLWDLIDSMYGDIESQLQYTFPSPTHLSYSIDGVPVNDSFEVLLEKGGVGDYAASDVELFFDGRKLIPRESNGDQLVNFGEINLSTKSGKLITLDVLRPVNLAEKNVQWSSPDSVNFNPQSNALLSIDNTVESNLRGMTTKLTDWQPGSYYYVSFDYRTFGRTFNIKVYEKDCSIDPETKQVVKDTPLNSKDWSTYQAIVASGANAQSAYVNLSYDSESKEAENISMGPEPSIEVNNVIISKIPNPNIILRRKTTKTERQRVIPTLEFQKINPTRYMVKVSNVKGPFTIVLSQAYSPNWKLVDMGKPTKGIRGWLARQFAKVFQYVTKPFMETVSGSVAEEYYGRSIREKTAQSIFLSEQTFGTWGKDSLADYRHFLVNGYANGWYVKPQDLDNKESYELVIEMTSQKTFYVSLAISLITVLGVLLASIFYIIRRHDQ